MRTKAAVASTFLALALLRPAGAEEWVATPARLALIEGEVLVQMAEYQDWVPASSNLPLGPGDQVWVAGRGRAEIQLPAGNTVRLGDETALDLRTFPPAGAQATSLRLDRGMATFYIRPLQPELPVFQVDLPGAFVQASIPSTFRADLFADGSIQVSVHAGEILVETPGGVTEVRSRQTLRLSPSQSPQLYALAPWDAFDQWNDLRDIQLSRSVSASYLPQELAPYAPDLVAYGHWVQVPEYGYAWAPIVEPGWGPFRDGRWVSWRGELVWISHERWGWVPYHYGRWRFYPTIGWVWIPPSQTAVIWNPGAVAWIDGPEFVAWIPLAPGEFYYGPRYYGPWSVNITSVQVTNIHITNVIVNARATSAVVVVPRQTFLAGGRAPASFVPPKDVFAAGGRVSSGPPPLRPVTATVPAGPSSMARMSFGGRTIRKDAGPFGESRGLAVSKQQGRDAGGVGARLPGVAGFTGPPGQPSTGSRRIAPENLLGLPPPRPTFPLIQRPAPKVGEVRSVPTPRPQALSTSSTPHGAVQLPYGRATGGATPSPQHRQAAPSVGQAGGR